MTRYARSGNSQKHQKMPEDPTPWEELVINVKRLKKKPIENRPIKQQSIEVTKDSKAQQNAVNNHKVEKKKIHALKSEKIRNALPKKQLKKLKLEKNYKQKVKLNSECLDQSLDSLVDHDCDRSGDLSAETLSSNEIYPIENGKAVLENTSTKNHLIEPKSLKRKKQRIQSNVEQPNQFFNQTVIQPNSLEERTGNLLFLTTKDESEVSVDQKSEEITDTPLSKKQLKKLKQGNKRKQDTTSEAEPFNQATNTTGDCPNNFKTCLQSLPIKKNSRKKELFLQRLQKKRTENGITLLSPKMERKLYMIKRRLREKGFTPEMIKDVIRKERRTAEIQLRKPITNKTCFNCRQTGHVLADCPLPVSGGSNPETGICFKCGSTEHTSFRCTKKISGYPFATCFICKKAGHISRDCPDNKHGVYIRGGKCNVCGSVNHFRKDCPSLNKKEKEQTSASVHTIFEGSSIDDEIIEFKKAPMKKRKLQKTKIVKF